MSLKEYSLILTTSFNGMNQADVNNKYLFPKFYLIPILHFQVVLGFLCFIKTFIAPIEYCVE